MLLPQNSPRLPVLAATALLLLVGLHTLAAAANPPPSPGSDLAASAARILGRRCFSCHGDGKASGLDLRTRMSALAGGSHGPALVPGKPEESRLYRSVSGREKPQMPPSGALPRAEQELLRRWIAAGAPWDAANAAKPETWWAFRPLQAPQLPTVRNAAWARHPVDRFILARLEAAGLRPAPPAGKRELIRRLSFDLTGLPPSPEEVRQFLADPAPDAYERLVDRLLVSPRYGERWARHWLDVVRFSESQGFERDKIREHAWRYRDYVIRAFNQDLPYDRFVREQIAGDVLPDASAETIAATGFLVAGPWDEVGNTQPSAVMKARVREDELEDMVSATAQTFLGLTVNCARCHDHKFDPIPQRDYYRLQAALVGVRHGDRLLLTEAEQARRTAEIQRLKTEVAATERRVTELDAAARQRVTQRLTAQRPETAGAPQPLARWTFEEDTRDSLGVLHAELSGAARVAAGRLVLDGRDSFARTRPLPRTITTRTLEAWVALATPDQRGGGVMTVEDTPGRVFDALVYGERQARKWTVGSSFFHRTLDLVAPEETTPAGRLIHVAAVFDADHRITLYRNGVPYAPPYQPSPGPESTVRTYAEGMAHIQFGLRHSEGMKPGGDRWLKGEIEEARLYDRALSAEEVAASFRGGPPLLSVTQVQEALTAEERAARGQLTQDLERLRTDLKRHEDAPRAYAASPEKPAAVHLLTRGDVAQKGQAVPAGALSCLPNLPADFGISAEASDAERRRKLAEWITHPANPLTPRVIVNRVWQAHFGRGLVASPSDFGVNGERPSHTELLDWLSVEMVKQRWSLKKLHRLIVTSNTYRQSTQAPAQNSGDAENVLLGRRSPRRLDAEEVRDAMLAVSGQLNLEMGGPGFRPFKVTEANTHFYTYEDRAEPAQQRRSIYRTVVNSGGVPLLEAFDCPDPSVKTPRRGVTTTPQQALVLLNSSFTLRQAREFARRLDKEAGPEPARQVSTAYELAFGRLPNAGEGRRGIDFVRRHGLRAFCRALLNAAEFVYVR